MTKTPMRSRPMKDRQHMINRARAGIKGLLISWTDPDPLRDTPMIIDGKVSHRNPVFRLTAGKMFTDFGDWITERQAFRWLVTIQLLFDYPNGQTQIEERELEAFTTIHSLNDHCLEQIRDALRHGAPDRYRHTKFTIECIGTH